MSGNGGSGNDERPALVADPIMLHALARLKAERDRRRLGGNMMDRVDPFLRTWEGFQRFCEEHLHVVPMEEEDGGRIIPMRLRRNQLIVLNHEIEARRNGTAPWFLVLKFRKVGITTLQQALAYWTTWRDKHRTCVTLAHRDGDTRMIFRMVQRFYEHQPEQFRHQKTEAWVGNLEYPGWDSLYIASTAGRGGVGRGSTFDRVHLSECAFFSHLGEVHTAIAKSMKKDAAYVLESTPNGREGDGGVFYEFWQTAKSGKSKFVPIFLPWHGDPLNVLPINHPDELADPDTFAITDGSKPRVLAGMDDEEEQLVRVHGCTAEQVKFWRDERMRIVAGGGSASKIHQEMPSDDESCFLSSTASYFDGDLLNALELRAGKEHPLEASAIPNTPVGDATLRSLVETGQLVIYELPDPGNAAPYVFGVDPAGGRGSDMSAIVGFNGKTGKQAFRFTSNRIVPYEFGQKICVGLGYQYANPSTGIPAYIVVELNNHGGAVLDGIIRGGGYRRDRLYHHTPPLRTDKNGQPLPQGPMPGWMNTTLTKQELTSTVGRMLQEQTPLVRDLETVKSIRAVTVLPNGTANFQGKDLAVAAGLAALALHNATEPSSFLYIGGSIMNLNMGS